MAERVRITGGNIAGDDNEGRDAQVDQWGNLRVREGIYQFDNKVYEDADFTAGESPVTHNMFGDTGRNSVDGYLIVDGPGNILVEISRRGLVYGPQFTMKKGERFSFLRIDAAKVRLAHSGTDSAYRMNLL